MPSNTRYFKYYYDQYTKQKKYSDKIMVYHFLTRGKNHFLPQSHPFLTSIIPQVRK